MVEQFELYALISIVTSSLALSLALLVYRRYPGRRAVTPFVIAMTCFLLAALFGYEIKYGFAEQEGSDLVMWSTRLFYFVHMLAVGYSAAFVGMYFYGFKVFRRKS